MSDENFDDNDIEETSEDSKDNKRREVLSVICGYCIQRNFKFDVISPKKWLTLTFESRNEKQDQGIDVFIDVRETEDLYFVVPAAYDVLIDEEIPAVVKAVNINNNYVNPARCSYSEKSKKVIVDYTYPIIDGEITLDQFTRVLMFVLESAEALRDNISKAQKKLDSIEDLNEDKIPADMKSARKKTEPKKYLKKNVDMHGDDNNEKTEVNRYEPVNHKVGDTDDNSARNDKNIDEKQNESTKKEADNSQNTSETDETVDFGNKLKSFFDEVIKNIADDDEDDSQGDEDDDMIENEKFASGFKMYSDDDDDDDDDDDADFDDDEEDDDDDGDDFDSDY